MMKAILYLFIFMLGLGISTKAQTALNNQPLYVVDGKVVEGVMNEVLTTINPNDVESVEILKDASSTALYGVRGMYGVVLVNTKAMVIKLAQEKLSRLSKQYRRYLKSNGDTSSLVYTIDGKEYADTAMSIPREVTKLSEKSIQKIEFEKPKQDKKGSVRITTIPQP